MAGLYTVDDVLAYMDIPMPEDDDLSEDDFEGYLKDDEDNDEGDGGDCDDSDGGEGDGRDCGSSDGEEGGDGGADEGGDGNNSSDHDNSSSLPEYTQHLDRTCNMTNKAPIDFFQLFVTDSILESTNLFAQQYMGSHELSRHLRVQQWRSICT